MCCRAQKCLCQLLILLIFCGSDFRIRVSRLSIRSWNWAVSCRVIRNSFCREKNNAVLYSKLILCVLTHFCLCSIWGVYTHVCHIRNHKSASVRESMWGWGRGSNWAIAFSGRILTLAYLEVRSCSEVVKCRDNTTWWQSLSRSCRGAHAHAILTDCVTLCALGGGRVWMTGRWIVIGWGT